MAVARREGMTDARSFAIAAHRDQRYGGAPYETHLANVEAAPPGSEHAKRYRREAEACAVAVRPAVPPAMWERLERALTRAAA